jgi:2,3-bisphosphoglycerate-dependent phosphoglycerate mutase
VKTLILMRHDESEGNAQNRFSGWIDLPFNDAGRTETVRAGALLTAARLLSDVVHTAVLQRAIATAALTLDACERHWIPAYRSWQRTSMRRHP